MIDDALAALATLAVLCAAMLTRPPRAECPSGWWLDGVRPDGSFTCAHVDAGDRREWPPLEALPDEIDGRVYCTGGARPIVVNYRTVGCQR